MTTKTTAHSADAPLLTVCQLGRLGDIVAMEPAFRFLHERHPERRFRWYTSGEYAELLEHAPYLDEVVTVKNAEEYLACKEKLPEGTLSYEFNFRDPRQPRKKQMTGNNAEEPPSLLQQFSKAAGLSVPDETPRFYFDPTESVSLPPSPYAVFHCTSRGRSRQWPKSRWHALAEFFFSSGYNVVEIGMEPVLHCDSPHYSDRTGKIRLQTAARIIAGANLFVGVESGFGHIANATGVFGIIITGKLRHHPDYNHYSGRFRDGSGCNLVRFYDQPAYRLPFPVVRQVAERFLSGNPMSASECDRFCLIEQLKAMRRNPGVMLGEFFCEPFTRLKNELAISRRKRETRQQKKS